MTMSVKEADTIDAMGVDKSTNTLVLLITDPYQWVIDEYNHLKAFQKKINNYVAFIENGGYRSEYGDQTFSGFRIEAEFKYRPTKIGQSCLDNGKKPLAERNIEFVWSVAKKG